MNTSVIRKPQPLINPSIRNSIITILIILIPVMLISFIISSVLVIDNSLTNGFLTIMILFVISFLIEFLVLLASKDIIMILLGAEKVSAGEIFETVKDIAAKAKIPTPEVYIIPNPDPNAFAVGVIQSRSAIGLNYGILQLLNKDELRGVIAHEIAHIKNRDTLLMTTASFLLNFVGILIEFTGRLLFYRDNSRSALIGLVLMFVGIIFRIIVAPLMFLAISRTREYMADETGARLINDPISLANALQKIEDYYITNIKRMKEDVKRKYPNTEYTNQDNSNSSVKNALKMMYIGNTEPRTKTSFLQELLSTHPPTEKRIQRLKELARELGIY
ncbi:MAG: M48 family metalloprotease [Candidatus Micrarchaeota archaeon]|nr:M48 family metalloprotease [Candidatus Micrarchaeota archaeon]